MKTVNIPEWAAKLAVSFLEELNERFGSDGCNDYDVPKWVPRKELHKAIAKGNGGEYSDGLDGYNHAVCGAVQTVIEEALEAKKC